eukprot:CAMPEP_0194130256 /NCGR_PEP_ID=MMETSP0152-20130528/1327_1 /TAXON_ID=1049557 /ORGANISM="Thalassiothrix antarctica, Strain L6-D1" /LENGTH=392 /DNA_ID=CAMNT_0038824701 /DNA_START=68 /DNA_END=1246 /DNA_ORIENTATION=+
MTTMEDDNSNDSTSSLQPDDLGDMQRLPADQAAAAGASTSSDDSSISAASANRHNLLFRHSSRFIEGSVVSGNKSFGNLSSDDNEIMLQEGGRGDDDENLSSDDDDDDSDLEDETRHNLLLENRQRRAMMENAFKLHSSDHHEHGKIWNEFKLHNSNPHNHTHGNNNTIHRNSCIDKKLEPAIIVEEDEDNNSKEQSSQITPPSPLATAALVTTTTTPVVEKTVVETKIDKDDDQRSYGDSSIESGDLFYDVDNPLEVEAETVTKEEHHQNKSKLALLTSSSRKFFKRTASMKKPTLFKPMNGKNNNRNHDYPTTIKTSTTKNDIIRISRKKNCFVFYSILIIAMLVTITALLMVIFYDKNITKLYSPDEVPANMRQSISRSKLKKLRSGEN